MGRIQHRMTPHGREVATLLWACVVLFAARVIGQFEVLAAAPPWLPEMDAWHSGLLPYPLLLPAQVALLMVMAVVAWNRRVRTGRCVAAHPRALRALRVLAAIYFAAMALRLALGVAAHGSEFWRAGAIPVASHWVLALFLLVSCRPSRSASFVRTPPERQQQYDEPDDVPHGDVPALSQPLANGLGLGKEVRYGNASR
jgi:uncharacterized membrane protein YozB (DUF420 family)